MTARLRRQRRQEPAELSVTAFMNLMVVLVPFLLIMAVFSRMAILELSLPRENPNASNTALGLEILVRQDRLIVRDQASGMRQELPNRDNNHDLEALSTVLQQLKARAPDVIEARLLLEPDLPYEQVVQLMDTVRVVPIMHDDRLQQAELFPDISLGDAPQSQRGS